MIIQAAILYPNGEVITAHRHYQITALQAKFGIESKADCVQGFVDHTGQFYTREEAKVIALECGQINSSHQGLLYSEDLWGEPLEASY